jgi:hypothetical protein
MMKMERSWWKARGGEAEKEKKAEMVDENVNDGAEEKEEERRMELAIACYRDARNSIYGQFCARRLGACHV